MSGRRDRPVILAALLSLLAGPALAAEADGARPQMEYIATHVWREPDADFGGFSGIEVSEDGTQFHVITDRAWIRWGRIERDSAGRIRDLTTLGRAQLQDSQGRALPPGRLGDSEGLAIAPDGTIYVSFEGLNRVARYDDPDGPATPLPIPEEWAELVTNEGFEALAITDDGDVLTLPEYAPDGRSFPIWRYRDGAWAQPFSIPGDPDWQAVGADMGPDGRLYLLERNFRWLLGFRSRVRRMELTETGPQQIETLLTTSTLQYDNLEGIAVWSDDLGIRITMISDDNFLPVQRTEVVEYRIIDPTP